MSLENKMFVTPKGDTLPMMLQEYEDHYLTEDDISLPKVKSPGKPLAKVASNITVLDANLWPNGRVPYVISINDGTQSAIVSAMAEWEAKTRVKFVPKAGSDVNYIDFVRDPLESSSMVGMVGHRQVIKLLAGQGSSTILHEIGHAIGLFHEQARSDRDANVSVMTGGWQNCTGGICTSVCYGSMSTSNCTDPAIMGNNSLFLTDICPIQGTPYGPYDKNSIMHYRKINSCRYYNPVLDAWFDAKPGTASLANAGISISQGDIDGVKKMYLKGWRNPDHQRVIADVNGDGKKDIIGFGEVGVYVSLSNGTDFNAPSQWSNSYGYAQGWDKYTMKMVADVNGDGKADIVGFGYNDVLVSLSNGSSFGAPAIWHNNFSLNDGWDGKTVRTVADVNGDGKADIVGFGYNDVIVSLSTGSSFSASTPAWHNNFAFNDGWDAKTVRMVADVNGDGKADVVGFGYNDVIVALSTGSAFGPASTAWHNNFAYNDGWDEQTVRTIADVNGDGKGDLVGFGYNDVFVALSNGSSFQAAGSLAQSDFAYNDGWTDATVRRVADFSGDGKADLVGFGLNDVMVARSTGTTFPTVAFGLRSKFVYNSNEWNF